MNGTHPTPKGCLLTYIQKNPMYYYLVLTSPDKVFHNCDELYQHLDKTYESYAMISEVGETGDNPHLNIIIKETKRLDNVKRALKKIYYGKELERFESTPGFLKYGAVGKVIKNELQLKNISVYLTKEEEPDFFFWKTIDIKDLCKDEPSYVEHKVIQDTLQHTNMTFDKLLDLAIELYIKSYFKGTLNFCLIKPVPPPDMYDLQEVLITMSKNKINCVPIYRNFQPFFLQFMSQLGNHEYIELFIRRQDEKLRKTND